MRRKKILLKLILEQFFVNIFNIVIEKLRSTLKDFILNKKKYIS